MQRKKPEIVAVDDRQLQSALERAEGALEGEDCQPFRAITESSDYIADLVDNKNTTIAHLRKLLFGERTEKTATVLGQEGTEVAGEPATPSAPAAEEPPEQTTGSDESCPPQEGHGRNGADDFPGATHVAVPHKSLTAGGVCPACQKGTVYEDGVPSVLIRFHRSLVLAAQRVQKSPTTGQYQLTIS